MLSDATKQFLHFMQQHPDEEFSKQDLSTELSIPVSSIGGMILGLSKRGYLEERKEELPPTFATHWKPSLIRWYRLTEAGKAFDPDEEERAALLEKAQQVAARRKKRMLEKEERARINSVL